MAITLALLESLKFGLSFLNTKESNEVLKRVIYLENRLNDEKKKDIPANNVIDNINDELCVISKSIQKFKNKNS